jgi:alpha-L-fucosidase 2
VMSIARPDGKPVSLTLVPHDNIEKLKVSPRQGLVNRGQSCADLLKSDLRVEKEWITYENSYTAAPGGYDNAVRVIAKGGHVESDGKTITIASAKEVLLIAGIEWYAKRQDGSLPALKDRLTALPADYRALLKPHAEKWGALFNRVTLDLNGGADRRLTSEELIARAKAGNFKGVPPALIEKLYDASRFYFLCSSDEVPPNLQGIWNGVFTAPWAGSYTYDTNIENAMDSALSANMPEGMEPFFRMIESHLPDWRANAKNLFGCRGVAGPITTSPNTGLNFAFGGAWAWNLWPSGAGWIASYFYDYYRFTGDKAFLEKRAVPLMKEIALFYEDYLTETNAQGQYIFRPSCSPEVGGVLWSDNSVLDVAIAKELLTNLITACATLGIEKENIVKWRAMLAKMPPYQVGPQGDLSEWADGSFRHAYGHRHHSPFYPLFRSFEFTPDGTPELWRAATIALEKKRDQWLRKKQTDNAGIPFGRAFHGQCAAYLGDGPLLEEVVNLMTDRVYPSLHMSLQPNGGIFNFDGNGAYPDLINRSLVFSLNGTLDLLRAIPPGWETGSITGILARGQLKIERLQWNQRTGIVNLELTSGISQEITVRAGTSTRKVVLPADKTVKLEINYKR